MQEPQTLNNIERIGVVVVVYGIFSLFGIFRYRNLLT